MLYTLHEAQRAILRPLSTWAEARSQVYPHPSRPLSYAPFSSRVSAGFELIYRFGKEYQKPDFGVTSVAIDGIDVPVHKTVVLEKPFCTLLHFEREFPA